METNFIKLSEELVRFLGEPSSPDTAVVVRLCPRTIFKEGNYEEVPGEFSAIEVRPAKGDTLYCMDALVRFVNYHKLSMWTSGERVYESDGYTMKGVSIYAHIF